VKANRRTVGAIAVGAAIGFAYGLAPAVRDPVGATVFGESLTVVDHTDIGALIVAIVLYGLGVILVPLVPAGVMAASEAGSRRTGYVVLIVAVATAMTLGFSVTSGVSEDWYVGVFIIVVFPVSLGSFVGCKVGDRRRRLRERRHPG
jgi:MFS family permease